MEVRKVGVIGAGIMGSGIAQLAAQAGFSVTLQDISFEALERALNSINQSLGRLAKSGKVASSQISKILRRIKTTLDLREAAAEAGLVFEAVPENMELKQKIFQGLDRVCRQDTILASNTSCLSITVIASATKRPDKVIGVHFAPPVPVMAGVEIIKGMDTSEETLQVAKKVVHKMGKWTFMALDSPGFAANRLYPLMANEAFYVVWQGIATAEDIDNMYKLSFRYPMGPLELADFAGLDTLLAVLEYLHENLGEKYRPCPLLKQLVQSGHYGRKTGRGVYKYS